MGFISRFCNESLNKSNLQVVPRLEKRVIETLWRKEPLSLSIAENSLALSLY